MRLSRSIVQGAACLGVLAGGIVAAVIPAAGGAGSLTLAGPEVLRLVQDAPAALSSYPAVRMTGTINYSFAGHDVRETLTALTTPDNQRGTATISVPSLGKQFTFTTVNHKLFVYLPSAPLARGAHYGACNLPTGSDGLDAGNVGVDPMGYLRLMPGATGRVRVVGHATIDGAKTTEYQVTIDLAQAIMRLQQQGRASSSLSTQQLQSLGVTTMPYDVWIDVQKAIRQFSYHVSVHGFGVKAQFRLSGATTIPAVSEPPASDVFLAPSCSTLGHMAAVG